MQNALYHPVVNDDSKELLPEAEESSMDPRLKYGLIAALAVVALVCFFVLAGHFSNPETYASTIESLDAKKATVMQLIGGSTAASGAITLLPGDAGTPIAEKLVDLSSDFLIVLAAIYLEKYLLTVLGFAAFKILIPAGCILGIITLLQKRRSALYQSLSNLSWKLALFGIAAALLVPTSVFVSNMIETTYKESIDETLALAQQTTENIEAESQAAADDASATEGGEDSSGSNGPVDFISDLADSVTNQVTSTATELTESAQTALNGFIEALAMMIVTSCIIPILVLIFFLWLIKLILGVNIDVPLSMLRPRTFGRHR